MQEPAQFTPPLAHAERAVRRLQGYFPDCAPDRCCDALAEMYGHENWEALRHAIAAARTFTPCDEDVPPEIAAARFHRHYDVALLRLAGMNDEAMLAAQELDQEVLSAGSHSISRRYDPCFNSKRTERARYAFKLAYVRLAVLDAGITAETVGEIPPDRDDIDYAFRVDLLPRALRGWIVHHRPLLAERGEAVGRLRVRQHAAAELLDFSFRWGELCLNHAQEIPLTLQIYPVALCAKWFAWLACWKSPELKGAFALLGAADERRRRNAETIVAEAIREEEARFILAQPKEEFRSHSASARAQQINAGYAIVKRWMTDAASESTIKEIMARGTGSLWPAVPAMRGS